MFSRERGGAEQNPEPEPAEPTVYRTGYKMLRDFGHDVNHSRAAGALWRFVTAVAMHPAPFHALLLLLLLLSVNSNDYFTEFERQMVSEKSRQATLNLGSDFTTSANSPKEIEILCQGSPIVTVKDIASFKGSGPDDEECLVIKVMGDNFSFQLSLTCDQASRSEIKFDGLQ